VPIPFVVRGATVIDGTGVDPVTADVSVGADCRIHAIGPSIAAAEDSTVVDGTGLVLCPGFIDMHSHSDLYTLVRPGSEQPPIGDGPKLLQGCTAQVFGQDGISAAPVADDDVDGYAAYIAGLDGFLAPARWTWRSFAEYLHGLQASSSTRVGALVGHSTVRRLVMGMAARPPTPDELEAMTRAVGQAMADGALGLSTGLVYAPASFASTDELIALCRVVAARGGRFFVHVRSESDRVLEATEEVIEVARRTGVHLHYSHIKAAGRHNWHLAGRLIDLLDQAREDGVQISSDIHPYTAGSTTASVLLPPWVMADGVGPAVRRLADPSVRDRIRGQLRHDTTSWDNWWAFSDGWDGLVVAGARRPGIAGRSLASVIASAGVADPLSRAAFDVVFDLLVEEELAMSIVSFNNTEDNVGRFLSQPHCSVGSDALVNPEGHPHPRLYGTFPRVLGRYVREQAVLSLPEAVCAMTGRAADALGRADLGRLTVGARGDLVLLDPDTVADRATYEKPRLAPVGIKRVWVAGRPVVADGQFASTIGAAANV
jgi:N-acyl-D-amino-acid deacylase